MTKKILDVTCGSRTIWFNKNHPAAIYCDVRDEECTGVWKSTNRDSERTCIVHPDVLCDFTDLPFPDNSLRWSYLTRRTFAALVKMRGCGRSTGSSARIGAKCCMTDSASVCAS